MLVKEAGGAVLDWNGRDLGGEEVGLDKKKAFHVVIAATETLGKEVAERMLNVPEIKAYMAAKKLL